MLTEDHPIDYGDFEGVIPKGNYGAGNVIIWDHGTYEMVDPETPEKGWKKGKLHFVLKRKKAQGASGFWFAAAASRKQWIFFKVRDDYASPDVDITEDGRSRSFPGRLVDEIGEQSRAKQWVTPIERELEQFGMKKAGRAPLPKNIQPMLATLVEKPFDNDDWLVRAEAGRYSRCRRQERTKARYVDAKRKGSHAPFPDTGRGLRRPAGRYRGPRRRNRRAGREGSFALQSDPTANSPFRCARHRAADEQIPVYFYAFDLLYLNGYNLMKFPLVERKAVLRKLIPDNDGWIRFADHVEENGVKFFEVVSKHDLEGIVAKLKTSEYQQARSKYWLKIKTQQTDHFVVGGFTAPEGSRKYFGALLLGLYQKRRFHLRRPNRRRIRRSSAGGDVQRTGVAGHKEVPFKEVPAEVRRVDMGSAEAGVRGAVQRVDIGQETARAHLSGVSRRR